MLKTLPRLFIALLLGAGAAAGYAADAAHRLDDRVRLVDSPTPETLEKIAQGCQDAGEIVIAWDAQAVVCEIPLDRGMQIAARVLLRAPFAASPHAYVRFCVDADDPGRSVIRLQGWVEQTRANGTRRSAALSGRDFAREMDDFLGGL